ncbi:MAG: hypothetical protein D6808_05705 [Candidatus Dadabacteria bacterium]|nr:MAG: hypothetical protein D6808_05705 [Candidatus Dadabacteria bacterium]
MRKIYFLKIIPEKGSSIIEFLFLIIPFVLILQIIAITSFYFKEHISDQILLGNATREASTALAELMDTLGRNPTCAETKNALCSSLTTYVNNYKTSGSTIVQASVTFDFSKVLPRFEVQLVSEPSIPLLPESIHPQYVIRKVNFIEEGFFIPNCDREYRCT